MGRQTRFYAHPDDDGALAAGLDSLGAVAIDDRGRGLVATASSALLGSHRVKIGERQRPAADASRG